MYQEQKKLMLQYIKQLTVFCIFQSCTNILYNVLLLLEGYFTIILEQVKLLSQPLFLKSG